jgi:hypothetical protein
MILTQVKMDESLVVGEFVQWDTQQLEFVRCTDMMNMQGVVSQPPELVNGVYVGLIRQAGVASAIAGEDIPEEGGPLGIDASGRAIISSDHSCGMIQAQPFDTPPRLAGDLIVVWIR